MALNTLCKFRLGKDICQLLKQQSTLCALKNYSIYNGKFLQYGVFKQRLFFKGTIHRNFSNSSALLNNWVDVTFVTNGGNECCVKVKEGDNLLDAVVNNDLDFDGFGACEGGLSCSTCHLVLSKNDYNKLGEPSEEEKDMLDMAYDLCETGPFDCVSFAGCGFLSPYLIGAASCLLVRKPNLLSSVRFCGASAGSLLAAVMACGLPLETVRESVMDTAIESRRRVLGPFSPSFKIEDHLRNGLRNLPSDAHLQIENRLFISLTRRMDKKSILISSWKSREELIECLLCSCFIPGFSGFKYPVFRGEECLDGGFSNNLPIVGKCSLTISPFAGKSLVCPNDFINNPHYLNMGNSLIEFSSKNVVRLIRALIPLPIDSLNNVFQNGFDEMSKLLDKIEQREVVSENL